MYRLYREEGLVLRSKQPRWRKIILHRQARLAPQRPNEAFRPRPVERWTEDPDADGGRGIQPRSVGDRGRTASAGEHVVEVLNRLVRQRGAPKYLFADNGAEFTGRLVDLWAEPAKVSAMRSIALESRRRDTTIVSGSTSPGPASRRITHILKRRAGRSGMNASMSIGSLRCLKRSG